MTSLPVLSRTQALEWMETTGPGNGIYRELQKALILGGLQTLSNGTKVYADRLDEKLLGGAPSASEARKLHNDIVAAAQNLSTLKSIDAAVDSCRTIRQHIQGLAAYEEQRVTDKSIEIAKNKDQLQSLEQENVSLNQKQKEATAARDELIHRSESLSSKKNDLESEVNSLNGQIADIEREKEAQRRRRKKKIILGAVIFGPLIGAAVAAIEDLNRRQKDLEGKRGSKCAERDRLNNELQSLHNPISELNWSITLQKAKIDSIHAKIKMVNDIIKQLGRILTDNQNILTQLRNVLNRYPFLSDDINIIQNF
ncbi:MAG TPA: hypothetical protein PLO43_05295, partial [Chlamydiales bacterium]|nr:hypothetical protein [Chlamydiales bacterium]